MPATAPRRAARPTSSAECPRPRQGPSRRVLLLVAAGVSALLVLATGPAGAADRRAEPLLAAARPNVVLVLTDDQTMESVSRMPHLGAQRWIRFPNAFVENALCCPSRASILQGRWDTHTGVLNNAGSDRFDPRETVATSLRRVGYRTALVGKYLNFYAGGPVPPGWDDWQVPYTTSLYGQYDYPLDANGRTEWHGSTPADYQVDLLARRASQFIHASATAARPFFLYFAPTATHDPWRASPTREGTYATAPVRHPAALNEADVSDKPAYVRGLPLRDVALMDAKRRREWEAAASVDDAVARLDAQLRADGVDDDTVLIFMTDNGYAFGEHRWVTKRCEYDVCSRTPMLVRYPGQAARTDRHLVTNVDIAPTVEAIAGAGTTLPTDGASLLPFLRPGAAPAPASWRAGVLLHWSGGNTVGLPGRSDSFPQFWGVRTTHDKYVELDTGEREYYDLVADPHELQNRVAWPAYAARVATLKAALAQLKAKAGAGAVALNTSMPGPVAAGPDVD